VLTPKFIELLSIAYDGSFAHMYAPGTSRHIKGSLRRGATIEEIMELSSFAWQRGLRPATRSLTNTYNGMSIP
jgi:alkylhydroperoxidase/carboxymuconolactone decarboxylase family protein YurZ